MDCKHFEMETYCKVLRVFRKNSQNWVKVRLNITAHAQPVTLPVAQFLIEYRNILLFFSREEAESLRLLGQDQTLPIIEIPITPKEINLYCLLLMLQIVTLIAANCMSAKLMHVFYIDIVAGALCFPLTYSISALIVELFGFSMARNAIIYSVIGSAIFSVYTLISVQLPPASAWPHQESYALVFNASSQVVIASSVAIIFGDLLSSYLLAFLKERTKPVKLYTRVLLSSALGMLIDSVIFILIAHSNAVTHYAFSNMLLKVMFHKFTYEAFASVIVYFAIKSIRKHYPNIHYKPLSVRYLKK